MDELNKTTKTDFVIIYVDGISFKIFIAALVVAGVLIGLLISTLCV